MEFQGLPDGIDDLREVYRSAQTVVLRGLRHEDGLPVLAKTPSAAIPDGAELARYRREFRLLLDLQGEGIVRAVELQEFGGRIHLVLADVGARSLADWLLERTLSPGEVLDLLIGVAATLERVHLQGIVHKDLSPSNLVWNPDSGVLQVIDFGISSTLARERSPVLEGTLPYLAPEGTGRVNRPVDSRSDLYSLGATAFHLLTGRPPFESTDPLALVHAHLAVQPPPASSLNPEVPPALSEIVATLLAKDPQDRYQGAAGLLADLRRCRAEAGPFPLREVDRPAAFSVPDRVYGRIRERQDLLAALAEVRLGRTALVLVAGPAGIGKSSLVAELHGPVLETHGLFAAGRYELLQRDTPYQAVQEALRQVLRSLLSEGESRLARWRSRLSPVLGTFGRVLAGGLPELEHFSVPLGESGPAVTGGPEARARSHRAYAALVQALASSERPLVLFLDDLQWADVASLELLEFLATDTETEGLLLLACYRDVVDHPLARLPAALAEQGFPPRLMSVGPLDVEDVEDLLVDACRCDREAAAGLAAVLHGKTAGNPFFLRALLERLHREGLLWAQAGGWRWDLEEVRSLEITDNVVDMLLEDLRAMAEDTRIALRTAACLGHRFEGGSVAEALGRSAAWVARSLRPALERGLVRPEGAGHGLVEFGGEDEALYSFAHDRVQEASYALLPEADRAATHLGLGRLLLARWRTSPSPDGLFDAARHLELGLDRMEDPAERRAFAELALEAGRRAQASAAFEIAHSLFEAGLRALGEDRWEGHYDLTRELCSGSAQAAFVARERASMEARLDELGAHARSLVDELPVWITRLRARMNDDRMEEAVALADRFLEKAGRPQPRRSGLLAILWSLLRTKLALRGRTPEELLEMPETTDPLLRGLQEIQMSVAPAQSLVTPHMIPVCILRDVRTVLSDGITAPGAQCWTGYALILAAGFGQVQLALRFGDLALAQVERLGSSDARGRTFYLVNALVRPWGMPLSVLIANLRSTAERALEVGDTTFAFFSAATADRFAFHVGTELGEVKECLERTCRFMVHHRYALGLRFHKPLISAVDSLRRPEGPSPPPWVIREKDWDKDRFGEVAGVTLEIQVALVFGDVDRALEIARGSYPSVDFPTSGAFQYIYWTYAAVSLLDGVARGRVARSRVRGRVRHAQRVLQRWSRHQPSRAFRLHWLRAADLRSRGSIKALEEYDRALDLAREAGFRHDAALIAEHAAGFCEGLGRQRIARAYRLEALAGYRQWGAHAKVAQLEGRYPEFHPERDSVSSSSTRKSGQLDLDTMLKASQALLGELRMDALLRRTMELAMENAGADRGVLVVRREGAWIMAARAEAGVETEAPDRPVDLDDPGEPLPVSVLRYAARAREVVLLDDAAAHGPFHGDPYVVRERVRSVLCLPLLHAQRLAGLLYLENRLSAGVFTFERTEVLRSLSAQMALSLTNAQLYARSLELTRAYARFVPHDFLGLLGKESILDVALGDQVEREMTVMFSDLRDFTTVAEGMAPAEVFSFINSFLGVMEPIIRNHRGFIDKYLGDAIMALFPDDPADAVAAAVAMVRAVDHVQLGIGLNTGRLTLGTVGSPGRMDGTVLSDAVNLSSRIQDLCAYWSASLLVSESTLAGMSGDHLVRPLDRVRVKGRARPVDLYEVFDADPVEVRALKLATRPTFEAGVAAWRAGRLDEARDRMQAVLEAHPGDVAARIYVSRCDGLQAAGLPPGWDGVTVMEHK